MSNKDNNHIVDVNKKISSVEWLIQQIECRKIEIVYSDKIHSIKCISSIIAQAKAMHKEETVEFTFNYFFENQNGEDIGEYYKQTYGE